MRSIITKIFVLSIVCILTTYMSAAQEPVQCIALITGMHGNVQVKKAGKPDFVKALWGTQLFQGDQVKTLTNADATLTYSNNTIFRLQPDNLITVAKAEPISEKTGDVKKYPLP